MKVQPKTLLECFEASKRLSAERGFKIFTPSRKYFRNRHQYIAASNDTRAKGIFRVWIERNALYIEFYPFHENLSHQNFLEKQLGIQIKQRRHRRAMRRFSSAHHMVTADEHQEFNLFVPNIRLP